MLSWIDFGQVAAERDDLLSEYFYDNGVLSEVSRSNVHFLVLGRKGAGKTAVFKRFDHGYEDYLRNGDCSVAISLDNYDWTVHELLSNPHKAPALAFIESWKFFIYVQTVVLLEEVDFGSKYTKKLLKIIGKIYGSPTPSLYEIIGGKLLQLAKFKLPSGGVALDEGDLSGLQASGGEVAFSDVQRDESMQNRLSANIGNVVRTMERGLADHFSERGGRAFVTFDRVDEAWVQGSVPQMKPMIGGLVSAADSVTQKFRGALRPVAFLREDIFDYLEINDKNKLRSDCGQLLAWSPDTLNRLIMQRVNYFSKAASERGFQHVNELFDKDKMRQQRKPFDYLILRTMMRPRDLIKYLQLTKEDMISRRDNPFEDEGVNENALECDAIYNAEAKYSEWLVEEIQDEWRSQFPEIRQIIDALAAIGSTVFKLTDFRRAISSQGLQAEDLELRAHLRFLYDNSIIGFKVGKSQIWRFKCFYPAQGFLDADVYKVHDGLTRGLNLKEPRTT